jgi:hypothetical protein
MTPTLLGPLDDATIAAVSWTANILTLLCVAPLCWATWRYDYDDPRRAHPRPVTWAVWFLVGMVATVGLALGGAPTSAWTIKLFLSLGPIIVAVVALYRGESWLVTAIDRWSLILGGVGVLLYIPVYFGWWAPADAYAAGLVAAGTAILVDAIGAGPTWEQGWRHGAPLAEIVTFGLAFLSVCAVLCILPWPWTLLSCAYLIFLAAQMVSIIVVDALGSHRHPQDTATVAGSA